ncbi:MAG: hypothetical protein PHQ34_03695 [Methanothrix sp.]|nr:hypothetical protein [Methanothrix sp.]
MKFRIYCFIVLCLTTLVINGLSQSQDNPVFINLIVDMDLPPNSTPDQLQATKTDLLAIFDATTSSNIDWNLFVTKDTLLQSRNFLAGVIIAAPSERTIEVGVSELRNNLNEKLTDKSYQEQKALLEDAKIYAEACKICGVNEVEIKGFIPQLFDQNEDTYRALDDVGFEYNAGFQAGILYEPGHQADVWPYKVENHEFYAVPISTYVHSGDLVPLDDRYAEDNGISSTQWKDMLIGKFNEISGKDEPMIISLSSSVSGKEDYLEALKEFTDFAISNGAQFVLTSDLVEMSRNGIHVAQEGSAEITQSDVTGMPSDCPECEAAKQSGNNSTVSIDSNESEVVIDL